MRLGVIDVGSNTVHLLAVDAHAGAHPLPAYSHKIDLRLSEHVATDGSIDGRGTDALVKFVCECRTIAEDQGLADLLAFATSAIREAPNGDAVLARVREESGIELQVLTGEEESRLTFLAARRWFGWSSGRLLVVDIGGGSLELAAGIDEEADVALSLPLGAGRLTRAMVGDPPDAADLKELRRGMRSDIAGSLRELTKVGVPDRTVGTSKTMRSLARITGAAPSAAGPYVARRLERAALHDLVLHLATMPAVERVNLPGVSEQRAPQLLAGSMVAEATMDLFGLDHLDICPWALREGLILRRLDWISG